MNFLERAAKPSNKLILNINNKQNKNIPQKIHLQTNKINNQLLEINYKLVKIQK